MITVVEPTITVVSFSSGPSGMRYPYVDWFKLEQCKYGIKIMALFSFDPYNSLRPHDGHAPPGLASNPVTGPLGVNFPTEE